MSTIIGASLIGIVSYFWFSVIDKAKNHQLISVTPLVVVCILTILLFALSFLAFHKVRVQRDQAREDAKGYDPTEKEPWDIYFAKWTPAGLGVNTVGDWIPTLVLDAKTNNIAMRLYLKSQRYARVGCIHLRVVDLPRRYGSQTLHLLISSRTFLTRPWFYIRNFGQYWKIFRWAWLYYGLEPTRKKSTTVHISRISLHSVSLLPDYDLAKDIKLVNIAPNEWQVAFPSPYEISTVAKETGFPTEFHLIVEAIGDWDGQLEICNESLSSGNLRPSDLPSELSIDDRNVYRAVKIRAN